MSRCPRCAETALVDQHGVLHEAVCPSCQGRFLDEAAARQVIEYELGIENEQLQELSALFGGLTLTCPGCGQSTRPVTLRGVPVDVCFRCGGLWCDAGELERLSSGRHREIPAEPTEDADAAGAVDAALAGVADTAPQSNAGQRRLRPGGSAGFVGHCGVLDDGVLWEAFAPFAQYSRHDMPLLSRRAAGIVLEDASREDAEAVAGRLNAGGVEAFVDDTRWVQPPHAHQLRRMVVEDERLRFIDMHERPWDVRYDELVALNVGLVGRRQRAPQPAPMKPASRKLTRGRTYQGASVMATAKSIYDSLRESVPKEVSELTFDVIAHDGRVQVTQGSAVQFADAQALGPDRLIDAMARVLSATGTLEKAPVFGRGFLALDEGKAVPHYQHVKQFDREAAWARWWAQRR